jgi:glycosyltransferase involved in cell wall biosynthesis
MMEAMCSGCAVITTGSGGAIEIADIADLPIFPKDHPVALSRLIAKLVRDRELVFQIATRGQKVVLREFSFTRMAERICNTFQMLCEQTEKQTKARVPLAG